MARATFLTSRDDEETQLPTIPTMGARLLGRLAALTAAIAILIGSAPAVNAQPPPAPDPGGALTLPLDDLGADAALTFYGTTSSLSVFIPVPVGLFPTSLNVTVDSPFNIRSGTLTITQDDRLIGQLGLPLTDLAPLVIPLDSVEIVDESVSVDLTLTALAEDGYCLDTEHPIRFFNGSITYAGEELAPTTVADFLPPILRTLTIAVPDAPSEDESEAAVQLAAALAARYRSQSPQVVLVPLADGATAFGSPSQPFERRIIVKEGLGEGVSLVGSGVPDLLISGPADKLTNNARLLTHGSLNMAVSTTVIPGDVPSVGSPLPGNLATLAELGRSNLTAVGVAPRVSIGLDQTRFGHPTQGYRLHVMGTYTPVPAALGSQMTAAVGGEIIGSWPTEAGGGVIDQWVDIPDRLVQRYTTLEVSVQTSGNTGYCGDFRPVRLEINGSTVVESAPAKPPIPTGFQSLPQALMPRMLVGMSANSFADTARATQIAVGLQRLSVVRLSFDVTSLEHAIDGDDPAVLISADGWTDSSISLPVSSEDGRLNLIGVTNGSEEMTDTTLSLDPGIQFGSLQTVFDGQRTLLIATSNGAAGQLDELLRWLASDPTRWSGLRGNTVVAVAGREPEIVPDGTAFSVYGPPTSPTAQESSGSSDGMSPWWALVGVGGAVAVGIVAFRMGARRSRSGSSQPGDDDDVQS